MLLLTLCAELADITQALSLRYDWSMLLESPPVMPPARVRRRKTDSPTFRSMQPVARAYVVGVVVAGAACLLAAAFQLRFSDVLLFVTLIALALVTSAAKIELPLGRSQSNLSLSHVVNFWALFALGPPEAICIAAVSAWAQCTLRTRGRNPFYRTVFSIASLTLTVALAGLPLVFFDSGAGVQLAT